ncbi:hypothetical protein ANOM_007868 [Aspergillus nomiae NRRL 13137]|uniref:DUF7587 domain-containing protein n=1 Tax=Aspergillus nomiae NRRL (strain ATCC 15546 / NRRL 13137 / CBS 260.88 / M93) TaxID=1509407 RepID=A0A0L1IT28_ASPN3|nr:uncharacterized protein ANOM_007868 [Aspergillus nomiae NRRL 13137]KNG82647.1 hypothetical protein ANOM_007868 [Aspergillus nomiae NRRL 13137]
MAQTSMLTQDIAPIPLEYVPAPTEEEMHPWYQASHLNLDQPLLRVWDSHSGVKPTSTNCMYSRCSYKLLDTFETRAISLAIHAHHGNQTPTPYISFTKSAGAVQRYAEVRAWKRGSQMLTVVNPRVRAASGRHLLSMVNEMRYYGVRDPFGMSCDEDEYLCLWMVSEEEVVGHWEWSELAKLDDWYEAIILPAFREHNKRFAARSSTTNSSNSVDALSDTFSSARKISRGWGNISDEGDSLRLEYSPNKRQDSSSEAYSKLFEDYSDLSDSYYESEANVIAYLLSPSEDES